MMTELLFLDVITVPLKKRWVNRCRVSGGCMRNTQYLEGKLEV